MGASLATEIQLLGLENDYISVDCQIVFLHFPGRDWGRFLLSIRDRLETWLEGKTPSPPKLPPGITGRKSPDLTFRSDSAANSRFAEVGETWKVFLDFFLKYNIIQLNKVVVC